MARDEEGTEVQATETPAPVVENVPAPAQPKAGVSTEASATEPEKPVGPSAEEIAQAIDSIRVKVLGDEADEESGTARVAGLLDQRDVSTGVLPDAVVAEVKILFGELPNAAAKSKFIKLLRAEMHSAVVDRLDAVAARAMSLLIEALSAGAGTRATVAKVAVDPTDVQVDQAVRLMLAPNLMSVGTGVADDWVAKAQEKSRGLTADVQTYRAYQTELAQWEANTTEDKGEVPAEPDVNQLVKDAARIARGRKAGSGTKKASGSTGEKPAKSTEEYSGPRRSIAAHIQSYFADKGAGTFARCGEISKYVSAEYGGTNPAASQGAISAHLFGKDGAPKSHPEYEGSVDANGVKGARKR